MPHRSFSGSSLKNSNILWPQACEIKDESIPRIQKTGFKIVPFSTRMSDENGFHVGMGMGIAFENGYGYGYRFLKPVSDRVKGDQNMVKPKNKCST